MRRINYYGLIFITIHSATWPVLHEVVSHLVVEGTRVAERIAFARPVRTLESTTQNSRDTLSLDVHRAMAADTINMREAASARSFGFESSSKDTYSHQTSFKNYSLTKSEIKQYSTFVSSQFKTLCETSSIADPHECLTFYRFKEFVAYLQTLPDYHEKMVELGKRIATDSDFRKQVEKIDKDRYRSWADKLTQNLAMTARPNTAQYMLTLAKNSNKILTQKKQAFATAQFGRTLLSPAHREQTKAIIGDHQSNTKANLKRLKSAVHDKSTLNSTYATRLNIQLQSKQAQLSFYEELQKLAAFNSTELIKKTPNIFINGVTRHDIIAKLINEAGLCHADFAQPVIGNKVQYALQEYIEKTLLHIEYLNQKASKKEQSTLIEALSVDNLKALAKACAENKQGHIDQVLSIMETIEDKLIYANQILETSCTSDFYTQDSLSTFSNSITVATDKYAQELGKLDISTFDSCRNACQSECSTKHIHGEQRVLAESINRFQNRQDAIKQLQTTYSSISTQNYELPIQTQTFLAQSNIPVELVTKRTGNVLELESHKQIVDLFNKSALAHSSTSNELIRQNAQMSFDLANASLNQSLIGNHEFAFNLVDLGHTIIDTAINCNPIAINQWQLRQIKKMTLMATSNVWHMVNNPTETADNIIKGAAAIAQLTAVFDGEALEYMTKQEHAAQVEMIVGALRKNCEEIKQMSLDDIITHAGAFIIEGIIMEGIFKCFASAAKLSALKTTKCIAGMNGVTKDLAVVSAFKNKLVPALKLAENTFTERFNFLFKGGLTSEEFAIAGTEVKVPIRMAEFVEKEALSGQSAISTSKINTKIPNNYDVAWGHWVDMTKVTHNDRTYAKIGDYFYTQHAIERMTPVNFGTAFGGVEGRGIPISVVQDVISNGIITETRIENGITRICKTFERVSVVLEDNIVITILYR